MGNASHVGAPRPLLRARDAEGGESGRALVAELALARLELAAAAAARPSCGQRGLSGVGGEAASRPHPSERSSGTT
jgi:hypothetical protein